MICAKAWLERCAFTHSARHVLFQTKFLAKSFIAPGTRSISTGSSQNISRCILAARLDRSSGFLFNGNVGPQLGRRHIARRSARNVEGQTTSPYQYPRILRIYSRSPWTIASFGLAKLLPTMTLPLIYFSVRQAQGSADFLGAISIFAGTAIPMHSFFRPVVADIHLKLPPEARRSGSRLSEYVKALPRKEAIITFTTMSFFGLPTRTEESLDDLRVVKPSFTDSLRPIGELTDTHKNQRVIIHSQKQSGLFRGKYEAMPGGEGENQSEVKGIWSEVFRQIKSEASSLEKKG